MIEDLSLDLFRQAFRNNEHAATGGRGRLLDQLVIPGTSFIDGTDLSTSDLRTCWRNIAS